MILNQFLHGGQLLARQAVVFGQRNARLNPEFRFAITTIYMNVDSFLLAGEEKEPVRPEAKHSWTHGDDYKASNWDCKRCGGASMLKKRRQMLCNVVS